PAFGQPHGHLAYDADFAGEHDGRYETVFLRPIMPSSSDTSLETHFVLQPV
ncbi:MAG: Twin-arginine translocation pathway signal, partial [Pseudomonadota bacterium]